MKNMTAFVEDGLAIIRQIGQADPKGLRLDAGESAFFQRQLEVIESRLYEKKFKELKYRRLIPVSSRDGAGASSIIYYLYTKVGMAKIIANPADDLPRADVFAQENIAKVHSLGDSFGFSTKDLRRAQRAGVPLEMMKIDAARRGIRVAESEICWNGDTNHGMSGVFTNTNIPNDQAPLNAGATSRAWADKTADEILFDITTLLSSIVSATNGVHEANTLLLPISQFRLIANKPRAIGTDTTILGFIMNPVNKFGLDEVDFLPELAGAGTGASDMALAYERDPEVVELLIPMEMQLLPPERRNLEMITNVESEIAGTVVRYPLAMRKLYDI